MAKSKERQKDTAAGGNKSRTARRREERKRQEQRRRMSMYAVILIIVAVVAVGLVVIINQPAAAPIPEGTSERYAGIPQGPDEDGFYVLGNPAAPVRVVEYSSFSCPACQMFYESAMDTLIQLVREGVISYTFIPRYVGSYRNAEGAARAALCAGEQGEFFEFHDALFAWQTAYGNTAFSQNRLISGAEELGLDVGSFRDCLDSGRISEVISASNRVASDNGFVGAPITTVNGVQVETTVDALVTQVRSAQGNQPLVPLIPGTGDADDVTEPDEVTPEATPDAEATPDTEATAEPEDAAAEDGDAETVTVPDIAAPIPLGVDALYEGIPQSQTDEGFFALGPDDAPVTVEEFASFSCSGCQIYHEATVDYLAEQAREGSVQLIYYVHFTGSIDRDSVEDANRAAFCAGQQGEFFSYVAALYGWHDQFGNDAFDEDRLLAGAANLGLDVMAFSECYASDAAANFNAAARDLIDVRGVNSTPTIFVNDEEITPTLAELEAAVTAAQ
ncbi:MAG: thioredoxin domain-containing protein [Chloroflexota bacterium]